MSTLDAAQGDPDAARAGLRELLVESGGPLIERLPGHPDSVLVTFVVMDSPDRPWVRCPVFDGVDAQVPLHPLGELDDVWWVERTVNSAVAATYQYQTGQVELPSPETLHDPDVLHDFALRVAAASFPDPFNDKTMPAHEGGLQRSADRHEDDWESVLILPDAEDFEWGEAEMCGRLDRHDFVSAVFGNSRLVTVWSPGVVRRDLPVVILLDGESFLDEVGAVRIVEQLVSSGRVEPLVVAFVHNATELSRMTEMPCHPGLNAMIAEELLPFLRAAHGVSDAPERVHLGGFSFGGLASAWVGLSRPDAVGNVIAMSPSFWWGKLPPGVDASQTHRGRDDRPEWLTRQVATIQQSTTRFWLEMGTLENASLDFADGVDPVSTARRFRQALEAKGFTVVDHEEIPGGHDMINWRRALPHSLLAMLPGDGGTS